LSMGNIRHILKIHSTTSRDRPEGVNQDRPGYN
jgi:hypothetical protein